jgi:F0F1-type ATP synthase gamma subunit
LWLALICPAIRQVLLVVLSGDRGLCGGFNNFIIKKVRRLGARRCLLRRALS